MRAKTRSGFCRLSWTRYYILIIMGATCTVVYIAIFWSSDQLNSGPIPVINNFVAADFSQVILETKEDNKEEELKLPAEGQVSLPMHDEKNVVDSTISLVKASKEEKVHISKQKVKDDNPSSSSKIGIRQESGVRVEELEEDVNELSSFANLDGSPYKWREHSLSEGLIYIHDQKFMKLPTGSRAKEWLQQRCQGFDLSLKGVRSGVCHATNSHPLVTDQRICKATKSDESYRNSKAVWAVSKSNPLYDEEMYTLVVPAFLRIDALVQSMRAFAKCPELSSYHIVWGNPKVAAPVDVFRDAWKQLTGTLKDRKPLLHIHLMSVDTLNNRYLDLPGISTKAVVHIDDDQTTNCRDMQRMLIAWRAYPQQLVSPHVRAFSCWGLGRRDGDSTMISNEKSMERVGFKYWGPVEEPFRGFECALTKFAMAHRCFSAVYSYGLEDHEGHMAGKAMVTEKLNGEDILFQGTASYVTGLPPVFIQGIQIEDTGADDDQGISTRRNNNHFLARQVLVREITRHLGFTWISQDFKIPRLLVNPDQPCPD